MSRELATKRPEPETDARGRAYCYRCMRVQRLCLCELLTPFETQTELHVLQHRGEARHAFNTVKLLRLGIANLQVHAIPTERGGPFDVPPNFPETGGVLYPGPDSRDLASLPAEERPERLVVIDGTWSQAHRLFRDHPWLHGLQRYHLRPDAPSLYRIRKEPRSECLSTLESAVMALQILEPQTRGAERLLQAFVAMNDRQIAIMKRRSNTSPRMKRPRNKEVRAVPEALWSEPEKIVVCYGESAQPFVHRDKRDRELAQWTAMRLLEPERQFHAIIATDRVPMPSGDFLRDLQWTGDDLAQAETIGSLQAKWHAFVRPGDRVVAWNKSTLRMARAHGLLHQAGPKGLRDSAPLAYQAFVLKELYANTTMRSFGTLDDVVAFEGLAVHERVDAAGRAAARLANAHAAAGYLVDWARKRVQARESA